MFKYLGQHIFDFVSKFRNDVYFQNLEELDQNFSIVVGPDGKLSKSKSPAEKSIIEVRNDEGSVIPAGAPLYSKGEIGGSDRIKVGICDASDPAKMPCIGIAQAEMDTSDTKDNFAITQGVYNTNISGFTGLSEGDTLYVNGGSAPYLTSTKPSNGNYIQNVGIVLKTNGTICQGLLVSAIGRTNDVPWPLYVDVPNSRVGIGTTSPLQPLHVSGNIQQQGTTNSIYMIDGGEIRGTSNVTLRSLGTFIALQSSGSLFFQAADTERMRIDSTTGNVGIGTTSPQQLLDITATTTAPVLRLSRNQNIGSTSWAGESLGDIEFYTNDPSNPNVFGKISLIGGPDSGTPNAGYPDGHMAFFTAGQQGGSLSEKMRITDEGKVGIGTTSPSQKLHVEGTSIFVGQGTWPMRMENNVASGNAEMGLWTVTDVYAQNEHFSLVATPHPNDSSRPIWYFQASGNGWRDITLQRYGGRVGIRTLTPNANLTVQGHGTTTGKTFLAQDSNASALFTILDNGKVGIGTTSPTEKLEVSGNIKASGTIKGKMEQMFACSFADDLGTTKHYLPFTSNAEQTNIHADQAAMVMPYNGRVKSIQMRLSNIDAAGDRTFSIETIAPGINMYASSGLWTTEETETYTLAASDDYYLVNYVFANSQHFSSGDLLAISIQDSADLYTASRQTYITVIVEYDLNNGMGNDTATTKYTS